MDWYEMLAKNPSRRLRLMSALHGEMKQRCELHRRWMLVDGRTKIARALFEDWMACDKRINQLITDIAADLKTNGAK